MWYVLKSPTLSLSVRNELKEAGINFFLPTHTILRTVNNQSKRIERPIVFNFVFVNSDYDTARDFCKNRPLYRLHVLYNHKPLSGNANATPVTISDKQMEMFQKAIKFYNGQEVPFIKPEEIELEKGDHVRIIGGKFSGLEGVLMTQKGKEGGRVVISLSNVLAVNTLEIEPEYLQILKYGKDGKHLYKHLDSYIQRLERIVGLSDNNLTQNEIAPVLTFTRRFSELTTDTKNAQVKVLALLNVSYKLLKDKDNYAKTKKEIENLLPQIKSQTTLSFVQRWTEI